MSGRNASRSENPLRRCRAIQYPTKPVRIAILRAAAGEERRVSIDLPLALSFFRSRPDGPLGQIALSFVP
jgi:hypothetical protein